MDYLKKLSKNTSFLQMIYFKSSKAFYPFGLIFITLLILKFQIQKIKLKKFFERILTFNE